MKKTETSYFLKCLTQQKSSILNKTVEFKADEVMTKADVTDEAEVASRDLSLSLSIHLHEREQNHLLQVERALARLEQGVYDECELCGDEISVSRLKARPLTTFCLACQEDQEATRFQTM